MSGYGTVGKHYIYTDHGTASASGENEKDDYVLPEEIADIQVIHANDSHWVSYLRQKCQNMVL